MTKPHDDIPAAIDRVASIRSDKDDEHWARVAAGRLVLDGISEARVSELLHDVAEQLETHGQSAVELFGDPHEWVEEQLAMVHDREGDGEALSVLTPPSLRDIVIETFVIASYYSVLFVIVALLTWSWGQPLTLSWLVAPFVLGAVSRVLLAVFTYVRAARSFLSAVIASLVTGAVGVALTVGVFMVGNGVRFEYPAVIGVFGSAFMYGVLAWLIGKLWPKRPIHTPLQVFDDGEWLRQLGATLRIRGDMSDAQVNRIVADSRAFAEEAGTRLVEEFGTPQSYALRFTKNRSLLHRRTAWLSTAGVGLVLVYNVAVIIDGTLSVWPLLWLVVIGLIAAFEWRDVRREAARRIGG
ncbi:DUF1129 domain-containing protein [Devriesea agamarum]|uniref:hypothetical protein n=1 Tax=Devriesea agamarum TaxID=472569 RepID=UPI00071D2665|nr:hypothetical protein [Devriesea agamarum]